MPYINETAQDIKKIAGFIIFDMKPAIRENC
jgi:hypothetical protein